MSAIIGMNDAIAKAHANRALQWAQLDDRHKEIARKLHFYALGDVVVDVADIGPIYVRMSWAMKRDGCSLLWV